MDRLDTNRHRARTRHRHAIRGRTAGRAVRPMLCAAFWLLLWSGSTPGALAEAPLGEPTRDALVDAIPFHAKTPPGYVVIDLAPDGRPAFPLMLDTGAGGSYLTPVVARAMGVNVRRTKSSPYREPTRLGRDLQFWVDTSASDTGVRGGSFEVGLLGADFLDDYVIEIDYPGRTVRFYDPEKYQVPEVSPSADVTIVPFQRNGTRFFVEVEFEDQPTKALVDTGASMVVVGKQAAKRAGISSGDLGDVYPIQGLRGVTETRHYEARSLRIGGLDVAPVPVFVEVSGPANYGGPVAMLLGYDVLGQFKMRIDYPRRRLWLERNPEAEPTFLGRTAAQQRSVFDHDLPRPTEAEIAAGDAARLERFEQAKKERVYARTPNGGFVVVDGYRLRNGPKPGETWYSHEEMVAILEAARSAEDGDAGAH